MIAIKKLSGFDKKYIKNHYITEFRIDDNSKKIYVYYIDGSCFDFPLTSQTLNNIKRIMKEQYVDWRDIVRRIYMFHPVKLLYLNIQIKKQKYYLEHEKEFSNLSIRKNSLDKKLSKSDINNLRVSKKLTHSYFNLSSVSNYELSTMKKIHKIISVQNNDSQKKVK